MRTKSIVSFGLVVAVMFTSAVSADTVEFLSGEIMHGKVTTEQKQKQIVKILPEGKDIKPDDAKTFYTFRIKRIIKGNVYKNYLAKKEKCRSADDFYKLGEFCHADKLSEEAAKSWEEAIKLDPNHEKARKALGYKKDGDKWIALDEIKEAEGYVKFKDRWVKKTDLEKVEKEEIKKQYESAYPINLSVGVVLDADDKWFERFSEEVKIYNQYIWTVTEGLLYLNNVEITDKANKGEYRVVNLDQMGVKLNPDGSIATYGITYYGSHIEIAGRCDRYTFIHEYGHFKFDLHHHNDCIMKQGGGTKRFCDDCLAKFISLSPKVKYRPDFPKAPPEVKIKCVNNK